MNAHEYAHSNVVSAKTLIIFPADTAGLEIINKSEILVKGELYDIVKIEIARGTILYYTLNDEHEEEYTKSLPRLKKILLPEPLYRARP